MDAQKDFTPWRERAFVTVAEASAIFARSPSWVRDRLTDNSLEAANLPGSGPIVVTVASVVKLVEKGLSKQDAEPSGRSRGPQCHLRLVVDNDPK